jgi:hypothetical protein
MVCERWGVGEMERWSAGALGRWSNIIKLYDGTIEKLAEMQTKSEP